MRHFLIMNPGSRGGKSRRAFKRILEILDQKHIQYEFRITSSLDEAYTLSLQANKEGYDVITAVGGDGTINRCLNGFYQAGGRRNSESKFAVIYTGTSPDFCKSYHIPLQLDQAVQVMLGGQCKKIRVGRITHHSSLDQSLNGQPLEQGQSGLKISFFGCCTNIGIGAAIARNANSGIRKYMGDHLGTFVAMIKTLFKYQAADFVVKTDGDIQNIQTLTNVINISVGRTTYIASGIKVKNNLLPDDERFYTFMVRDIRFSNLLEVFRKIYSGKDLENNEIVSLGYAEKIEVYGNSINPEIEFDGDPGGFLPCTIEIAEDCLDLICAAESD